MKILAINCGSSTLKFRLFESEEPNGLGRAEPCLASGSVDRIGKGGSIIFQDERETLRESAGVADHADAIQRVLAWLNSSGLPKPDGLGAVGHRVVHGGDRFVEPTLLNEHVIDALQSFGEIAPLHNGPSLAAIRGARSALGPAVPMVAVFDTAFHRTLPPRASHYAIPQELAEKHGIQRYGFHGLAHRYLTERYAAITSTPVEQARLVTLQLGNGCSATAVAGGRSLDTSMGFTPLEGLMMGTRSGDVDPSVVSFLVRRERATVEEVTDWLNRRSGLLGISGSSGDMRELLALERDGDVRAALAVEMFCYRIRKYVGAYLAVLGGANAVVFGGGIGENAPEVRARICAGMEWCGLKLDPDRNDATIGIEGRISTEGAKIQAYVIPVVEAVLIARDTFRCLQNHPKD